MVKCMFAETRIHWRGDDVFTMYLSILCSHAMYGEADAGSSDDDMYGHYPTNIMGPMTPLTPTRPVPLQYEEDATKHVPYTENSDADSSGDSNDEYPVVMDNSDDKDGVNGSEVDADDGSDAEAADGKDDDGRDNADDGGENGIDGATMDDSDGIIFSEERRPCIRRRGTSESQTPVVVVEEAPSATDMGSPIPDTRHDLPLAESTDQKGDAPPGDTIPDSRSISARTTTGPTVDPVHQGESVLGNIFDSDDEDDDLSIGDRKSYEAEDAARDAVRKV
jgi:hypothetical protein